MQSHPRATTVELVEAFYERIWNAGELSAVDELLALDFTFRRSLGAEVSGRYAFCEYVHSIRFALDQYRCHILDCVTEGDRAFAKMLFSGIHVGSLLGYAPTGKHVQWLGAALFRTANSMIVDLWVLGDINSLDATLKANTVAS
jgi:predicted ester cyclase